MKLHTASGTLPAAQPFRFEKSVWFLDRFKPVKGEQELGDGAITKAMAVDGQTVVFRAKGNDDDSAVDYELFSEKAIGKAAQQAVAERISFFLSLDDDLTEFYAIGNSDGPFAQRIEANYGLHHVKFLTLCETGVWAPLAQRAPVNVSKVLKRRLVEAYGSSMELDGKTYWAFPELATMAKVDEAELAKVISNERKAHYVKNVVDALLAVDEEFLRTAPYDDAVAYLLGIKGIGEWSAAFILLRGLGRMDNMPLNLGPNVKAMQELYGPKHTMEKVAAAYGPWLGYWAFYLRAGTGR